MVVVVVVVVVYAYNSLSKTLEEQVVEVEVVAVVVAAVVVVEVEFTEKHHKNMGVNHIVLITNYIYLRESSATRSGGAGGSSASL